MDPECISFAEFTTLNKSNLKKPKKPKKFFFVLLGLILIETLSISHIHTLSKANISNLSFRSLNQVFFIGFYPNVTSYIFNLS